MASDFVMGFSVQRRKDARVVLGAMKHFYDIGKSPRPEMVAKRLDWGVARVSDAIVILKGIGLVEDAAG